jgi:hypothetical protein
MPIDQFFPRRLLGAFFGKRTRPVPSLLDRAVPTKEALRMWQATRVNPFALASHLLPRLPMATDNYANMADLRRLCNADPRIVHHGVLSFPAFGVTSIIAPGRCT